MQASWVTDIHLNFLNGYQRNKFYDEIIVAKSDCLFITGDVADAKSTIDVLLGMSAAIKIPIYWVAGNHDYYHGSIRVMRDKYQAQALLDKQIYFLTKMEPVKLGTNTTLIGADGFADGCYGDFEGSNIVLNDARFIREYEIASGFIMRHGAYNYDKWGMLMEMQRWARRDTAALDIALMHAAKQNTKHIIVLTH